MFEFSDLTQDPRVRVRNQAPFNSEGDCVLYWMQRAHRAEDNPALDLAIAAGNLLGKSVVVFLGLVPFYPNANWRHYQFLAQGLSDIEAGLKKRHVGFVLRKYPWHRLVPFCKEVNPCLVIGDENPLREPESWRQALSKELTVPLWTVDTEVIIPSRLFGKEHFAARTIRPRVREKLEQFLMPPKLTRAANVWKRPKSVHSEEPSDRLLDAFPVDRSISPVTQFRGGASEAKRCLQRFLRQRLQGYGNHRNCPELSGTSQLSPYLHFGHIGPRTVALAVRDAAASKPDRDAFLEEFIVRRELAINFVTYNKHYDSEQCAENWAKKTIQEHAKDKRPILYSEEQLDLAQTHDPLWNAAQRQMTQTGWMHGYLRMYWAKKILEWTPSIPQAYEIAVRLNDRYELDGRDPNGYTGIAWAIVGKHDRAWGPERPIFGKIRYMSFESTSKKFDSANYIRQVLTVFDSSSSR